MTEVNPWMVRPGVVRDMTYQFGHYEEGSWFQDARDFYLSEVEVSLRAGVILKTEVFDESEILAAQQAAKLEIKKGREKKKKAREAARLAAERAAEEAAI